MGFTAAELAEMARADAEIEATFRLTNEDLVLGRQIDRDAVLEGMDARARKRAEYQRRYRESHKDERAEYQRRYRFGGTSLVTSPVADIRQSRGVIRVQTWRTVYWLRRASL